jgi:hypothetical protein
MISTFAVSMAGPRSFCCHLTVDCFDVFQRRGKRLNALLLWQDDLVSVARFIADCFDHFQRGGDPS